MPKANRKREALNHEEARQKVCAVCTNIWGQKAARILGKDEEFINQQKILKAYDSSNRFFPSGICLRCIHQLVLLKNAEGDKLKLTESFHCKIFQW